MRKVAAAASVLASCVIVWWAWPRAPEPLPPDSPAAAPGPAAPMPVPVTAATASTDAPIAEATAQRTEVPAPATPAAGGPECTLRGRVVDEQGNPIAGVQGQLTGWGANAERMDAWRKNHDEPQRIDAKAETGADGVFEFRCWPPPPFQFALRLTGDGRATLSGRWSEFAPGKTVDLGDLRMPRGTRLRGRVVDGDGVPVAGADVHFDNHNRGSEDMKPESWDISRTKADGTFVGRWALASGTYKVEIPHREIEQPKELALTTDRPEQFVEITLVKVDPADTIAGLVVDEQGKPLRGVTVNAMMSGGGWIHSTDAAGQFSLARPKQDAPTKVALSLHHDGYEWEPSNEQYAWGRTDLRFTMRKGLAVELLVVAADGGAPVEDWQARVFPQPGTRSMTSSDDFRVRTKGHHDGGRAVVTGVSRGKQFVVVEPKGDEFAVSACAPVEVADPGPARVTVSLSRNATRPLHVQSADGAPVAAALVRLADPNGNAVTPRLQVATIEQWGWNGCRSALQLQETTTDARGDAVLRGPQDRPLALFLPGPGHVPTAVADVSLATPEPLVVTVATGARLVGKVVPAAALAELRRQAGLPTTAGIDKTTAHMQPSVALRRTESGLQVEHPDGQHRATIGEDGAFEINGAPPGTWQVAVNWFVKHGEGMAFGASEECAAVDLRDGTTTSIEVDLSRLLPGTLDGLVLHNGAPLADTAVQAVCNFGRDALGNDRSVEQQVRTDADGRFHFLARAGACTVAWARQRGDQSYRLRAAGTVDVVAGQTVAQTFLLTTGTARVRLLDAQGGPAAKVAIELRDAAGAVRQVLPPTGDDGCTSGETEAETFTATVLPKRLQDPVAQRQVWLDNPGNSDPFAALRLRLGNVAPTAGATAAVELHLPASWDR